MKTKQQNKKQKKKYVIEFAIGDKSIKVSLSLIWKLLVFILIIILTIKLVVPMVLGLLEMFVNLIKMWVLLDDSNFKFIGGCFFLIVYYKIFSAIAYFLYLGMLEVLQNDKPN